MRKLRLYLDSSILGWSLNKNDPTRFAEANLLLKQIADDLFTGAFSWVVRNEIDAAPNHIARRLLNKVEKANLICVSMKHETASEKLADQYCSKGIVPIRYRNDALHIAIATLWKADALVSYNFEHIVSLETMVAVNRINISLDLKELYLCQPQEVILHDA